MRVMWKVVVVVAIRAMVVVVVGVAGLEAVVLEFAAIAVVVIHKVARHKCERLVAARPVMLAVVPLQQLLAVVGRFGAP